MSQHSPLYRLNQWTKLRRRKLSADPLCWYCLQTGVVTAADTVDHIRPHKGDVSLFLDWDNLQSLCSSCHNSLKQQQEIRGYHSAIGIDGAPIDKKHPWNK